MTYTFENFKAGIITMWRSLTMRAGLWLIGERETQKEAYLKKSLADLKENTKKAREEETRQFFSVCEDLNDCVIDKKQILVQRDEAVAKCDELQKINKNWFVAYCKLEKKHDSLQKRYDKLKPATKKPAAMRKKK